MWKLLKLASRNLRRNRRRTAISLVGLVLGVTVMVGLRGFINGMQRMITDNIVHGQLGSIQVHKRGYLDNILSSPLTLDMEDSDALRKKMLEVPGVAAVAPRINFGAMLSTPDKAVSDGRELRDDEKGKTAFFMALAMDPALEERVVPRRKTWLEGSMFSDAAADELVLNADFATGMDARLTARAQRPEDVAQWPALLAQDRDGTLNGANVTVGGYLASALPGDKKYGFVPLKTAQAVLRMEGRVTEYAISITPGADVDVVARGLQEALGPDYDVKAWHELVPFMKDLMGTQDKIFSIVTNIFLFVVLLGVVNAMLMSVLERVREIGTMLAVGTRRRQVMTLFLLEGAVLGALGGVLGVLLGSALVMWMSHKGIPLPAPGSTVASIVKPFVSGAFLVRSLLFATVGAALASLYPAWRASRLRPVEALAST